MSNYQSSFCVIDLKLDVEPSLIHCQRSACSPASSAAACWLLLHDARWSIMMNIYAQAAGGAYRTHILQQVSKRASSGSIVPLVFVVVSIHNTVFQAFIILRFLYAIPSWGCYLTVELSGKTDAFLCRVHTTDACSMHAGCVHP